MHSSSGKLATSGAGYFFLGFKLIKMKGIRRFVFVPLLVNLVLFYFAFSYLYKKMEYYMAELNSYIPEMFSWLMHLIWPLAVVCMLVMFSFIFSSVANWLAAPFNGLLSEKMEALLTNESPPDGNIGEIVKDIPRTFIREWQKFTYYLPRAIGFLLIFFILPIIGQVIWFLFVAWMMAIQYKDYPFDNHRIPFHQMRSILLQNKGISFSFGITTSIFSMLPIVNLVVMPVAICGATALWVDEYKPLIKV
ncbi:MAG: sulfate transporter CysZ [Thalassotalea sp.]